MVKYYVFWGLFGLVLAGIGITLLHNRASRLRREAEAEARDAARAKAHAHRGGPAIPTGKPPREVFDPDATRIHVRATQASTHVPLPEREEAVVPDTGKPRLVCVGGPLRGSSFPVTAAGTTVGRDAGNDIVIIDPRVSQHHAWVGIVDRKAVLRDLDSTNGTFLNAHADSLLEEAVLSPGDTVFFGGHGSHQFRFLVD